MTGVASRRLGWRASADAFDPARPPGADHGGVRAWLDASRPDVVFEAIALEPHTGEPALGYARAALEQGAHVVWRTTVRSFTATAS